jgi:cytochrome c oxidase assembly factor 4
MPTIVLDPPSKDKSEKNQTSSSAAAAGDNNDDEDHVTSAIRKTGCFQFHEKLQECYIEKKDWRSCTKEMQEFRRCMQKIQLTAPPSSSSSKKQ